MFLIILIPGRMQEYRTFFFKKCIYISLISSLQLTDLLGVFRLGVNKQPYITAHRCSVEHVFISIFI